MSGFYAYKNVFTLIHGSSFSVRTKNPLGIDGVSFEIVNGKLESASVESEDDASMYAGWPEHTVIKGVMLLMGQPVSALRSELVANPTIPYKATVAPHPIYGGGVTGNAEVPLSYEKTVLIKDGDGTTSWVLVLTSYDVPLPSDV